MSFKTIFNKKYTFLNININILYMNKFIFHSFTFLLPFVSVCFLPWQCKLPTCGTCGIKVYLILRVMHTFGGLRYCLSHVSHSQCYPGPIPSSPVLWLSALCVQCAVCLQLCVELSACEVLLKTVRHNLTAPMPSSFQVSAGRTPPHTPIPFQFHTCNIVTPYAGDVWSVRNPDSLSK